MQELDVDFESEPVGCENELLTSGSDRMIIRTRCTLMLAPRVMSLNSSEAWMEIGKEILLKYLRLFRVWWRQQQQLCPYVWLCGHFNTVRLHSSLSFCSTVCS